jgi:carbamoyltransferase
MIQLGISAFYHDSAACIVKDGKVLAAIEEERFTGIKHDFSFPKKSIAWLFDYLKLSIEDIDEVCWYENPDLKKQRVLAIFDRHPIKSFFNRLKFLKRHKIEGDVNALLKSYLNYEGKVTLVDHHISHVMFAYKTSPFNECAIVSIDGVGEWDTMTISQVKDDKLTKISETVFPHSLGMFYSTFTSFLGFKPNEGEYKVMGLAPYGNPEVYYPELFALFTLLPEGRFKISQDLFTWEYSDKIMFKDALCEYLNMAPRTKDAPMEQCHKDLAASVQMVYERIFMHILEFAKEASGSNNLCLSGGCAYNGVANNKAYRLFEHIWVPFAPSDSGSAIGACLASYSGKAEDNTSPYLGSEFELGAIDRAFTYFKFEIDVKELTEKELIEKTANAINENKVIGWCQGRMEFGARALGNRSILASPLDPEMKSKLNRVIKKREGFRPFAPSCTEEDAKTFFDIIDNVPYMNQVMQVNKAWNLPSITHADGSARVQTVNKNQNDKYYKLLKKLGDVSGFPISLNTSFNFKDQTITATPHDAIERFLDCEMDVLVINNYYITKL